MQELEKEHIEYLNLRLADEDDIIERTDLRSIMKVKIFKLTESTDASGLFDADPISFCEDDSDNEE